MTTPTTTSTTTPTAAPGSLTPSERLLLAGAAPAAGAAPGAPAAVLVPADPRVHELLAAAILANEQAGCAVLEPGTAKRWFGLFTAKIVRVVPTERSRAAAWPERTLEARVLAAALQLAAKGKHEAANVCDALVTFDANPEGDLVLGMLGPLRARGLVEEHVEEKTRLKVFKTKQRSTVLTSAGAALLAATPAAAAGELVERCRRERPEVWSLLWKAVTTTFARKTQRADADDISSSD